MATPQEGGLAWCWTSLLLRPLMDTQSLGQVRKIPGLGPAHLQAGLPQQYASPLHSTGPGDSVLWGARQVKGAAARHWGTNSPACFYPWGTWLGGRP